MPGIRVSKQDTRLRFDSNESINVIYFTCHWSVYVLLLYNYWVTCYSKEHYVKLLDLLNQRMEVKSLYNHKCLSFSNDFSQ